MTVLFRAAAAGVGRKLRIYLWPEAHECALINRALVGPSTFEQRIGAIRHRRASARLSIVRSAAVWILGLGLLVLFAGGALLNLRPPG